MPTHDGLLHDQPRAWFVVVERQTYEGQEMEPYVVGPFGEAQADGELQSDEGIVFCLLTIDAKSEGYVAGGDVYTTTAPPVGPRIVPVRDMPEVSGGLGLLAYDTYHRRSHRQLTTRRTA